MVKIPWFKAATLAVTCNSNFINGLFNQYQHELVNECGTNWFRTVCDKL